MIARRSDGLRSANGSVAGEEGEAGTGDDKERRNGKAGEAEDGWGGTSSTPLASSADVVAPVLGGQAGASNLVRTSGADRFADLERFDDPGGVEGDQEVPVMLRKTRRALTRAANPLRAPLESAQAGSGRAGSDGVAQDADADGAAGRGSGQAVGRGVAGRVEGGDHAEEHSEANAVELHARDIDLHSPEHASPSSEYRHRDARTEQEAAMASHDSRAAFHSLASLRTNAPGGDDAPHDVASWASTGAHSW